MAAARSASVTIVFALAVGGLVLVNDALAGGLVEQAACMQRGLVCGNAVLGLDGFARGAHGGLELGLDGLVAHTSLLVGQDTLFLTFDIRHSSFLRYMNSTISQRKPSDSTIGEDALLW